MTDCSHRNISAIDRQGRERVVEGVSPLSGCGACTGMGLRPNDRVYSPIARQPQVDPEHLRCVGRHISARASVERRRLEDIWVVETQLRSASAPNECVEAPDRSVANLNRRVYAARRVFARCS